MPDTSLLGSHAAMLEAVQCHAKGSCPHRREDAANREASAEVAGTALY